MRTTESILEQCVEWHEVGSRVTCDPPPTDTDRDILCFVENRERFVDSVKADEFVLCGYVSNERSAIESPKFTSLRRGEDNLIVSDDRDFVDKFLLATAIAKKKNIKEKEDRVTLFQWILYGNDRQK